MNKDKVIEHYDLVSPYYNSLWGTHIHHGYWLTGKETKEEAQENLTALLIDRGGSSDTKESWMSVAVLVEAVFILLKIWAQK